MAESIKFKLTGSVIENPPLPGALLTVSRGGGDNRANEFLPDGYVKVTSAYEVGERARSTAGAGAKTLEAAASDVVALEMADGVTVFTSTANLSRTLQRIDPKGLEKDGSFNFDVLSQRGDASRSIIGDWASDLVSRVFTLTVGDAADPIIDAARHKMAEWAGGKAEDYVDLGVTWLGTKALMWAIESRLDRKPGLYRWPRGMGEAVDLLNVDAEQLEKDAKAGPLLVFIHGTGSSSTGSFGDLQKVGYEEWKSLEHKFGDRIFAFEHRTFSESPIDNAIQLANQLPAGARVNIVTHSRGGLVGDLICLNPIPDKLISEFQSKLPGSGDVSEEEGKRLKDEGDKAHADHRQRLGELDSVLRRKQFAIQRYVRVASPARGTVLISGNLDLFLSGLLTLIGRVPYLYGNPLYYAVKRIVLEIAKNRTNARLVPGIEAMLPESPMARFLAQATPQSKIEMAIIAGDIEGGGLLKQLGVLFTDYVFFSGVDNDLVVDTDSMYSGIAAAAGGRALFDQGPSTSHFNYFENQDTRTALKDWLVSEAVDQLDIFKQLPGQRGEPSLAEENQRLAAAKRSRGGDAAEANQPIVVVLPGIMGSHLWRDANDRVWFQPLDLPTGGMSKLKWKNNSGTMADDVTAEKLLDMAYGELCDHLAESHQVLRFPYDWRLPLDILAERFKDFLAPLIQRTKTPERPIRILAHSMGGLVVRALIHKHPGLWDELMKRDGGRFIMLGTPNQGAYSMVEALIGKSDTLRKLARIDITNDLQAILDIIGEFRGALQLLPKPDFVDVGGAPQEDYYKADIWVKLKDSMKDFWFGDKVVAKLETNALNEGKWLWTQDGVGKPALPVEYKDKTFYVHGAAPMTACGITQIDGRWKMLGTERGDGTVTWESGWIDGVGQRYYMPAVHGDLTNTPEYFAAVNELLTDGTTSGLATTEPKTRSAKDAKPLPYEASPPSYRSPEEIVHPLMGATKRKQHRSHEVPTLKVKVSAMDLRFVTQPIMVGHYEQDPISGAEALIDSELVNHALSERNNLGLYAGPLGTAVVVLQSQNDAERARGSFTGAVVTGLGPYTGNLGAGNLTEAVRAGALRYLLHYADCMNSPGDEISLCALLLGYNSTASLTIRASVEALIRGVVEANNKYRESTKQILRIGSLEIVELYLDSAITAMHALRQIAESWRSNSGGLNVRLEVPETLYEGPGIRPRLEDNRMMAYWPRLMITDYDRNDDDCPPECFESRFPREGYEEPFEGEGGEAAGQAGPKQPPWLRRRTALAERIKFVHVGQRARAETILQQRQPGLVEKLVAEQMRSKNYQAEFCRTLFHLMVPHDFKDVARQLDRIVLVVDGYTANLPWELMLAEKEPLAVHTAVIRQLASTKFRRQVRQTLEPLAYVVGNPATDNFFKMFPMKGKLPTDGLVSLKGAEEEAKVVADALRRYGYAVELAIGQGRKALDVINPLYQKPYRIVHIAAHGAYDQRAVDGKARSGVVLSDGLFLTAAEIDQMEIVPDLVFLNCCHLAQADARPVAYNKLAYSISRELIEIGVRCVVAAGWAVDDDAAYTFAEIFYQNILGDNTQFGDAIFQARKETYQRHGNSFTWGAYQAYGDPGWRVNPRESSGGRRGSNEKFVAPEELIDQVQRIQMNISRQREVLSKNDARNLANALEALLKRSPKEWQPTAAVNAALGAAYGDLGADYFEAACKFYQQAIAVEDKSGRVPIRAIEQLANLEARHGEHIGDLAIIDRAIGRLRHLENIELGITASATQPGAESKNSERAAISASAYKRKAAVLARQILKSQKPKESAHRGEFDEAIRCSLVAYLRASGDLNAQRFDPYPRLNWLALHALGDELKEGVSHCQRCKKIANENFRKKADFWSAIMAADAVLTESLLTRQIGAAGDVGDQMLDKVWTRYSEALKSVRVKPKDIGSVTEQICLLALLFDAKSVSRENSAGAATDKRIAQRLRRLSERIVPGSCKAPDESNANEKAKGDAPENGPTDTAAPASPAPESDTGTRRRRRAPRRRQ